MYEVGHIKVKRGNITFKCNIFKKNGFISFYREVTDPVNFTRG